MTLKPLLPTAYGNVTVTLRGLSTPVIFILTSAQQEVDMRVDAKIPGHNPDADHTVEVFGLPTIDQTLGTFLDGVPPQEVYRLKVSSLAGVEAWRYQNHLYIRTKADAQYPAYVAAARSTSGVAVYRYEKIYNSVTLTTGGRAITIFVE